MRTEINCTVTRRLIPDACRYARKVLHLDTTREARVEWVDCWSRFFAIAKTLVCESKDMRTEEVLWMQMGMKGTLVTSTTHCKILLGTISAMAKFEQQHKTAYMTAQKNVSSASAATQQRYIVKSCSEILCCGICWKANEHSHDKLARLLPTLNTKSVCSYSGLVKASVLERRFRI